jgi:predicted glycosyltransferase
MNKKPVLLLYCQHSLGIGHLRRSIEIAKALIKKFHIVFINGGRIPEAIPRPEGIQFIDLPPLGMDANGALISHSQELNVNGAKELRREIILQYFVDLKPDVLLVELFPFGRKKFAFELLPLLRLAKHSQPKPLVVCDLRDILVDGRDDQQHFDDRARWITKRYFDAILMHTDPKFARLEESFCPRQPLTTPVFYTGFVAGDVEINGTHDQNPGIVVSAGGGNVGSSLFNVAVEAQPRIWLQCKIPMSIVAGPFLPETEWVLLKQQVQNVPGLRLYRSVPDLKCLLQQATVSVSQCGYNTTMDILKTRVPALLIPYARAGENEQTKRALKLEKMGIVRVLAEVELNADKLVQEINSLLLFKPKPNALQLDGANQSSKIILQLLDQSFDHSGEYSRVA